MKNLKSFSEQALIDCSWGYNNFGCHCDFGLNVNAYQWIIDNGCLPLEDFYGEGDTSCRLVGVACNLGTRRGVWIQLLSNGLYSSVCVSCTQRERVGLNISRLLVTQE